MKRKSFIKRRGTTSRSKAVKMADDWFSVYIRISASDKKGIASCVTCGNSMPWQRGDCGHFQTRGNFATRWTVINAHFQCGGCNMRDGEQYRHGLYIDRIHGYGVALELEKLARSTAKFTTGDLLDIAKKYYDLAHIEATKRGIDISSYDNKIGIPCL